MLNILRLKSIFSIDLYVNHGYDYQVNSNVHWVRFRWNYNFIINDVCHQCNQARSNSNNNRNEQQKYEKTIFIIECDPFRCTQKYK